MSTPSEHKHYTVKDIERYHSGKMSAQEMHAMEEAALDDPFLADAIEGYALSTAPAKELSGLENKLKERTDRGRENRSGIIYRSWFRVAVLLVILAGSGWFIYLQTINKNTAVALTKNSEPSAPVQNNQTAVETDSSNMSISTSTPKEDQTVALQKQPRYKTKIQDNKQRNEKNEEINNNEPLSSAEGSAPPTALRSEKVYGLDNSKETAQTATAATLNKPETISPYKDTDSTENLAYTKQRKPEAESTSVLNEAAIQRQKASPLQKSAARKAMLQDKENKDTPEPVNGWKEFENYITSHKKAPQNANGKSMSGEVQLSFDIDQDGQPTNIRVDQSLNTEYDQEAIRLLKEGPKWKAKDQTKARVTIHF